MKKCISLLCILLMVLSGAGNLVAAAAQVKSEASPVTGNLSEGASICRDLGILKGTSSGVTPEYTSSQPTRLEAAIVFLRLKGLENEAISFQGAENFSDASGALWENGVHILSYLKANPALGFVGDGQNFYPGEKITAQEYYKVLLTALGYKIGPKGDCGWTSVLTFSASIGITKTTDLENFSINALACATVEALKASLKNDTKTLAAALVHSNIISEEAANNNNLLYEGGKRAGEIAELSGVVIVNESSSGNTVLAQKGTAITEGDRISTGENSSVTISIDGDKKIKLSNNSILEFTQLVENANDNTEQTFLTLSGGKIWVDISKKLSPGSKFLIKSLQTVMSVKGTQFFVGQEDGRTDCAVLDGTVIATSYIPVEQSDGTSEQQTIETVLHQNQQVTLDDTVQSQGDVQVEPVTTETLDLFVLETIAEDSQGIDQSLLNNIDQVIEQIQQEQQEQQRAEDTSDDSDGPPIVYAPEITTYSTAAGSSAGTLKITALSHPDAISYEIHVQGSAFARPELNSNPVNLTPYILNDDISASENQHLGIYALNTESKIIAFTDHLVSNNELVTAVPSFDSENLMIISGSVPSSTVVFTVHYDGADSYRIFIQDNSFVIPGVGATLPDGDYSEGENITAAAVGKHLGIYAVDAQGIVLAFTDHILAVHEVSAMNLESVTAAPGNSLYSSIITLPGTYSYKIVLYPQDPLSLPYEGADPPAGAMAYTSGTETDTFGVDSYVQIYALDSQGKVAAYTAHKFTENEINQQ